MTKPRPETSPNSALSGGVHSVPQHVDAPAANKDSESRAVWEAMESEPGFNERLAKATREMDRGLAIPYRAIRGRRR